MFSSNTVKRHLCINLHPCNNIFAEPTWAIFPNCSQHSGWICLLCKAAYRPIKALFVESGGVEMRHFCISISLVLSLVIWGGCDGENIDTPDDPIDEISSGDIYGTIIDDESGNPIPGASISIGDQIILAGTDGKYIIQEIPFSDEIKVKVSADDYRDYTTTISLDQKIKLVDANLVPIDSPTVQILEVLESLSGEIEALDADRIPPIQSHFSEDYVAASDPVNDQATLFAVIAGVVPADFDSIPDTVLKIVEKYDELEFKFADPEVELGEDTASVLMSFEVYAETKPKPPVPAKKWEIVVEGELDFQKGDGDWKMTYWRLIPPFLKFEEEPLE